MKIKELNKYDLGRAYEMLERGVWPDWLDGKPADFDKLPYEGTNPTRLCKGDCTIKERIKILAIIGPREADWAKWRAQGMTEEEWEKWWNRVGKALEQDQPKLQELLRAYYEREDQLEEMQEEKTASEKDGHDESGNSNDGCDHIAHGFIKLTIEIV